MKIIDLLNKIANEEEVPKKIKFNYLEYEFNEEEREYQRHFGVEDYGLGEDVRLDIALGDEVEIIGEDKKIEKLYGEPRHTFTENELYIVGKVNEIIDYINKEK